MRGRWEGSSDLVGQSGESVRMTAQQMSLDKIAALKNHGEGLIMEGRTCNQYSQTTTGLVAENRKQNGTSSKQRKVRNIKGVRSDLFEVRDTGTEENNMTSP